jgi:predicted outer membrane repeat protein
MGFLRAALIACLAVSSVILPPARTAYGLVTLTVTTTAIADDPNDGQCDLWEALQAVFQANFGLDPTYHECTATSGINVIFFGVAGPIVMPTAPGSRTDLPFVHGNTTLQGPVTIEGGTNGDTHLLRLAPDATLNLVGVILKDGLLQGSGAGSAIYTDNGATVNVVGSTFINNNAAYGGGAIYANGDLNIVGSTFINNTSGDGGGGAIIKAGTGSLKIMKSIFTANTTSGDGGAIYTTGSGPVQITDSKFVGNGGNNSAVYIDADITADLERNEFDANVSPKGDGGAIHNNISTNTTVADSVFNGNGAAIGNGGAIYNNGVLTVTRSTFMANVVTVGNGGGIANNASALLTVTNSTFNSNQAIIGKGGGIYNYNSNIGTEPSTVLLRNDTFYANSANNTGGVYNDTGQSVTLGNTILDRGGSSAANCNSGGFTSQGHNLVSDASCNTHAAGDLNSTDPQLAALANNGGALTTQLTQMPQTGSPAIDAGDNALCASDLVGNQDETATTRPKDGDGNGSAICDIGALEAPVLAPAYNASPLPPGPINFGSVMVGNTGSTSFNVSNAGNITLTLSSPGVTDTAHFGVSTTFPVNLLANGQQAITLWCKPSASGPLQTTFSFHTNDTARPTASYTLQCDGMNQPQPSFTSAPVAPGPIEFGDVVISHTVTRTLTISNAGNALLTVSAVTLTGDGDLHRSVSLPLNVTPGGSGVIVLTCTPTQLGLLSADLHLTTNDPSQTSVSYALHCNGVGPASPPLVNTQNLKFPLLPNDLSGLFGVATSPDNMFTYVTGGSAVGGQVVVLKKTTSGLLAGTYLWVNGGDSRADLNSPHEVAISPDGEWGVATGYNNGAAVVYRRNSNTGALTYLSTLSNSSPGATGMGGAWGVAFSPDSKYLYVTGYTGNSIAIFKHILFFGLDTWLFVNSVTTTSDSLHPLTGPLGVVVSPDGKNVYVTAYTSSPTTSGTLAVYSRDTTTGALTPIQTRFQGDCIDSLFICIFGLNGLKGPFQVAISPDGGNVYVVGQFSNALVTFRRDPSTGKLAWYDTLVNGTRAQGLNGARGVAVSPDGKYVYTNGYYDKAMTVFDRDPATGLLTFDQLFQRNPADGTPALDGVQQVAVSSDGQYVFTTAAVDNAVSVFRAANPIPALTSLQPASAVAGSASINVTVKGYGFMDGSQVRWNAYQPTTKYLNSSTLVATIPSAWLASAGSATFSVYNPSPGGGNSINALPFVILPAGAPPLPGIDHLLPASVLAGAASLTLDIYGSNFLNGATVLIDNTSTPATFLDNTHLRTTVPGARLAQPGNVSIQVHNGANADSNTVGLVVVAPGQNPQPAISGLAPAWLFSLGAASPQFTLYVTGTNFIDGSTVRWNGDDQPTKFVDSAHLRATISGANLVLPGQVSVSVNTPAPGGGESNVMTFVVKALYRTFVPVIRR